MTDDEAEGRELGRQMEAATDAIRAAVLRLPRDGEVHPQLVVLAVARITDEVVAGTALAGEVDVEVMLGEGRPVLSVREFAELNEVSRKEMTGHLQRLEREGMIRMEAIGGPTRGQPRGRSGP